ncbi:MAG: class I SAM-dependent methyltransferase [Phycisphaerae bacterium]|nr:class I SAM-dependent methyltransferase [Phycisphaerae bacterium]
MPRRTASPRSSKPRTKSKPSTKSKTRAKSKSYKKGWRTAATSDRHELYELSVQEPTAECNFVDRVYKERRGKLPTTLREDFCGTGFASTTFVKRRAGTKAYGVDLCQETMDWGKKKHFPALTAEQRKRVQLIRGDVLKATTPPADVLVALNFSYFIWKTREQLVAYFRAAFRNIAPGGLIVLDAYGGYESFSLQEETRNLDGFIYAWETSKYNPINGDVLNHIHFRFPDGTELKRAFTYDWRLWTLAEIQEALVDAGFVRPAVYWEGTQANGDGDGVFRRKAVGEACAGWIAYVLAEKPARAK